MVLEGLLEQISVHGTTIQNTVNQFIAKYRVIEIMWFFSPALRNVLLIIPQVNPPLYYQKPLYNNTLLFIISQFTGIKGDIT